MTRRRALALPCSAALAACAAGLLACAAAPVEAPPAAATAPEAPLSPERQRFEQWKQEQPAADPRPDFERQAEAEAERRRREALEAGERLLRAEDAEPAAGGD